MLSTRFAFPPSRISLMTAASTRYPSAPAVGLLTTEVAVLANIGNRREYIGKVAPARPVQGGRQNSLVLLFAAAVAPGSLLS